MPTTLLARPNTSTIAFFQEVVSGWLLDQYVPGNKWRLL
jgi:hypothetical protein